MSINQLSQAIKFAKKFYLHHLLLERMQQYARDDAAWKTSNANLAVLATTEVKQLAAPNNGELNPSLEGLLKYETALQKMRISLNERDTKALPKQFHEQHMGLLHCAGHLYDQHNQAPYAEPIERLCTGHNAAGELLRRDAFTAAEQKLAQQLPMVAELKKILQQQPPKKLHEYSEMQAVSTFRSKINQPDLTPEQYQQALKELQRGVFNG